MPDQFKGGASKPVGEDGTHARTHAHALSLSNGSEQRRKAGWALRKGKKGCSITVEQEWGGAHVLKAQTGQTHTLALVPAPPASGTRASSA